MDLRDSKLTEEPRQDMGIVQTARWRVPTHHSTGRQPMSGRPRLTRRHKPAQRPRAEHRMRWAVADPHTSRALRAGCVRSCASLLEASSAPSCVLPACSATVEVEPSSTSVVPVLAVVVAGPKHLGTSTFAFLGLGMPTALRFFPKPCTSRTRQPGGQGKKRAS